MPTCKIPLQGVVHDVCMDANHDVSLQLQYLTDLAQPIPLDPATVLIGTLELDGDVIDLGPYLTLDDAAQGLIGLSLPQGVTAPYEAAGADGLWEVSFEFGGVRTNLISSASTWTVNRRLAS